jgi:hypothetical protein
LLIDVENPVVTETLNTSGVYFQPGCDPAGPYVPDPALRRKSVEYMCQVENWYQGFFDEPTANSFGERCDFFIFANAKLFFLRFFVFSIYCLKFALNGHEQL